MPGSNRNPAGQNKHDRKVSQIAREYKNKGYEVEADIGGWPTPGKIMGHRPDVIASKGGQKTIVEVETPDSLNTVHAAAQDAAFLRARRRSTTTHYKRIVTD